MCIIMTFVDVENVKKKRSGFNVNDSHRVVACPLL